MRDQHVALPLTDVQLPEVISGEPVDLGALTGVWALTLIRHRFCCPAKSTV